MAGGVGAAAGIIGVLLTRGQPTIIYPEQLLTFRIDAPVTIATERAPQAFRTVEPGDYNQPSGPQLQRRQAGPPPAGYGYAGPGPGYGPGYAPYYDPYPYYGYGPYYGFGYGYPGFYGGGIIIRGGGFRGGFGRRR
jgi:hypothetical protein